MLGLICVLRQCHDCCILVYVIFCWHSTTELIAAQKSLVDIDNENSDRDLTSEDGISDMEVEETPSENNDETVAGTNENSKNVFVLSKLD